MTERFLNLFRGGQRGTQTNSNVVGEMVAADGNRAGMGHHTVRVDNQVRGARADISQANAEILFVGAKNAVRRHQRFADDVVDMQTGAIRRGHNILRCAGRRRDHMQVHFEPSRHHACGIANARLIIENELLRQKVQDFAIVRQRNRARLLDSHADVVALHFTRART